MKTDQQKFTSSKPEISIIQSLKGYSTRFKCEKNPCVQIIFESQICFSIIEEWKLCLPSYEKNHSEQELIFYFTVQITE